MWKVLLLRFASGTILGTERRKVIDLTHFEAPEVEMNHKNNEKDPVATTFISQNPSTKTMNQEVRLETAANANANSENQNNKFQSESSAMEANNHFLGSEVCPFGDFDEKASEGYPLRVLLDTNSAKVLIF